MKRLYLMRHGHAPAPGEAGVPSDALRPLSTRGRQDVRRVARELIRRGAAPGLILHSPLRRAVETAAEAASLLKPAGGVSSDDALDNTRPPDEVVASLAERAALVDELLAVGHQPQLGELAALLARAVFEIRPGGVVAVETGRTPRALWSLNPEDLPAP